MFFCLKPQLYYSVYSDAVCCIFYCRFGVHIVLSRFCTLIRPCAGITVNLFHRVRQLITPVNIKYTLTKYCQLHPSSIYYFCGRFRVPREYISQSIDLQETF